MRIENRLSTIFAVQIILLTVPAATAAEKTRVPIALEGYVRDADGKPVEGVLVMVSEGSYTTQGRPLSQAVVAATTGINIDTSDIVDTHDINTHFTKTDAKGHYQFRKLLPGRYTFAASGRKKSSGDFGTHTDNLVDNKKLSTKYVFPKSEQIVIKGGEPFVKNVLLQLSQAAPGCIVPTIAHGEDSEFIGEFGAKAMRGNREAMRMLGYAYQHGQHGIAVDRAQAACWLRKAAAKGDIEASRSLRQLSDQPAKGVR